MPTPVKTSMKPRPENRLAMPTPKMIPGMYWRLKNGITASISLTRIWIAIVPMGLITVVATYRAASNAL